MNAKQLEHILVISLDLFDTLVRVRGFDPRYAFQACYTFLLDKGVNLPFEHFYHQYRTKIRHYLINREKTGNDFTNDVLMQELLKELGFEIEIQLARSVVEIYFEKLIPYTVPYPNLESTLRFLKDEFDLILTSNHSWPKHGMQVLQRVGVNNYFKKIVFSGDIGRAKPHPEIFEKAISDWDKKDVLHVGDNPIADVDGAQKFGIDSLWVHSRDHYRNRRLVLPTIDNRLMGEIREISELPSFLDIWVEDF